MSPKIVKNQPWTEKENYIGSAVRLTGIHYYFLLQYGSLCIQFNFNYKHDFLSFSRMKKICRFSRPLCWKSKDVPVLFLVEFPILPTQDCNNFTLPFFQYGRLLSAGLETVLSHTEKSCIALYYRQFSTIFF